MARDLRRRRIHAKKKPNCDRVGHTTRRSEANANLNRSEPSRGQHANYQPLATRRSLDPTFKTRFGIRLLRQAMEMQGFSVYEAEWWHSDYQDWRSYRIGNQRFEDLGV